MTATRALAVGLASSVDKPAGISATGLVHQIRSVVECGSAVSSTASRPRGSGHLASIAPRPRRPYLVPHCVSLSQCGQPAGGDTWQNATFQPSSPRVITTPRLSGITGPAGGLKSART
jgi:hypothetical protein